MGTLHCAFLALVCMLLCCLSLGLLPFPLLPHFHLNAPLWGWRRQGVGVNSLLMSPFVSSSVVRGEPSLLSLLLPPHHTQVLPACVTHLHTHTCHHPMRLLLLHEISTACASGGGLPAHLPVLRNSGMAFLQKKNGR